MSSSTRARRGYRVVPYLDRMDLALALADLVVSRAGAATVSELSALGIPPSTSLTPSATASRR